MSAISKFGGGRAGLRSVWALAAHPAVRWSARVLWYLAILLGLLIIYGKGDFSTPPFIYQGF